MSYTPPYPGGWKDFPDTSTPIDAASLDIMDAGIAAAQADADTIATTGYRLVETVYFTSGGTFTKATYPWLRAVRVRMVGGGGGGGGAATTGSNQNAIGAGGGGASYSESFILASALSSSETVTVGAGGPGGAAGNNNGVAGGQSEFAGKTAPGGKSGFGSAAVTVPAGGGGGDPSDVGVGDLTIAGGGGTGRAYINAAVVQTSVGGVSFFGGQRTGRTIFGAAGLNAVADTFGQGGEGGANGQSLGTARAGGNGSGGLVIVELYA
jgi:hypothetical protein